MTHTVNTEAFECGLKELATLTTWGHLQYSSVQLYTVYFPMLWVLWNNSNFEVYHVICKSVFLWKNIFFCLLSVTEKWWLSGQEGCAEDPGAQPQTEVQWIIINYLSYKQCHAAHKWHQNLLEIYNIITTNNGWWITFTINQVVCKQ